MNENGFAILPTKIFIVTGARAAEFLHGQLSNSVKDLAVGSSQTTLLLTQKGKVVADALLIRISEESFQLIATPETGQHIFDQLKKLAPLSRVSVTDESDNLCVIHLITNEIQNFAGTFYLNNRFCQNGYDRVISKTELKDLENYFFSQKIKTLTSFELDFLRVKNGIPKIGVDVTDSHLPQEGKLDHALHFNKGCYLGQEVIARLHFRGHINKVLSHFKATDSLKAGDVISDDNQTQVGSVTSAVFDHTTQIGFALGYLPTSLSQTGVKLSTQNGIKLEVLAS